MNNLHKQKNYTFHPKSYDFKITIEPLSSDVLNCSQAYAIWNSGRGFLYDDKITDLKKITVAKLQALDNLKLTGLSKAILI
jgi:hypothetical protein